MNEQSSHPILLPPKSQHQQQQPDDCANSNWQIETSKETLAELQTIGIDEAATNGEVHPVTEVVTSSVDKVIIHGERRKKKPYKELTLEEKVQLIRLAERCTNLSQANIAERYEIAKSNVCRILQRKEEYLRALESAGFSGNRKRKLRTGPDEEKLQQKEMNPPIFEGNVQMDEGNGDNDVLRAHMASEHQSGRMFLCRCCNWAFRDKNELHRHLKSRRAAAAIERKQAAKEERLEDKMDGNCAELSAATQSNGSAFPPQLPQAPITLNDGEQLQQHHHLFIANLWNNLLLGQHRLRDLATMEREKANGEPQTPANEQAEMAFPMPHRPVPVSASSVIVQNAPSSNLQPISSLQTGPSPSGSSDNELIILSGGSSSSSTSSNSAQNSHTISPSHSTSSGSVQNGGTGIAEMEHQSPMECGHCNGLKPRLALAQARCSYLEAYNASVQNELVRMNAKCLLAEQCIRRLEVELRQWRERNELLRFRLLECRDKALSAMQTGGNGGHLDVNKFVGEMLKVTLV